ADSAHAPRYVRDPAHDVHPSFAAGPAATTPAGCVVALAGLFLHVAPGGRLDRLVARIAGAPRCGLRLAGEGRQPLRPVGPPAAGSFGRLREPVFRPLGKMIAEPVAALALGRRIDHAGDMAAGTEHETQRP